MISAEEQKKVADLVKQTKDLILKEMDEEEVMIKGAANYVTNVDLAVQNFLKEELGKVFPEISLIAEEKENNETGNDVNQRHDRDDEFGERCNTLHSTCKNQDSCQSNQEAGHPFRNGEGGSHCRCDRVGLDHVTDETQRYDK